MATLLSTRSLRRLSPHQPFLRGVHDYIRCQTPGGTYKIQYKSSKAVGVYASRGSRLYQEDATSVHTLKLKPSEIQLSLDTAKYPWDPSKAGSTCMASQVAFFGIYDGHGGKEVSTYLKDNLPGLIESVDSNGIDDLVKWTRNTHGGYYKRWRGGGLQRWTQYATGPTPEPGSEMTLEERLTLAFLEADRDVLTGEFAKKAQRCGSTASVVLLHSLDEPAEPYWSSKRLNLTVGHCGDTRVLLCHRSTGEVEALTEKHHAEARVEATRLRRMGANRLVADSFGESRWMGVVENTRGVGDGEWKSSGVTAEPEVISRVLNGDDYAYMVLLTDGLTSLMSDQEIVDLARNSIDPARAAKTIVHFGEDLGAQDNCSCIVIPLAGWGHVGGIDRTEARREYRRKQADSLNTRMQRM
ncbi:phosphatase 2C-like domain-containing protein [Papiliotrema laurentii]|uniref:Phosphatase 2C-like domain-containing protein n=1 Tax=Papiliotrema laurentii TaxID=5418 RepID=A0AAD9FT63_PAPLA|nr:phosphatase 2C-like domain-containing protein [Papiliotrema laurentii]